MDVWRLWVTDLGSSVSGFLDCIVDGAVVERFAILIEVLCNPKPYTQETQNLVPSVEKQL